MKSILQDERQKEIPIRNIKLEITDGDQFDRTFNKERREITVKAEICPKDATYSDIKWIRPDKAKNRIKLHQGCSKFDFIFTAEQFDFALDYIKAHSPGC